MRGIGEQGRNTVREGRSSRETSTQNNSNLSSYPSFSFNVILHIPFLTLFSLSGHNFRILPSLPTITFILQHYHLRRHLVPLARPSVPLLLLPRPPGLVNQVWSSYPLGGSSGDAGAGGRPGWVANWKLRLHSLLLQDVCVCVEVFICGWEQCYMRGETGCTYGY